MRKLVYWLSLILIFSVAWEGLVRFPGLGTLSKQLGFALAVCWVVTVVATGRFRRPDPFLLATTAFVFWAALSVFWSGDPDESLRQASTWVQSLALVFILWDVFRTRSSIHAGLQAYLLGAYVAIGGAIANYFGSNPFYTNYDRFSPGATNPDGFGFIIALGIPVAWYLASSAGTTRWQRVFRVVNFAFIPAAFLGLALSGTRTAAVGGLVGMAFGLATLVRLRPIARVAILVAFAYAFYALLPVVQPLRSFERLGTTTVEATDGDLNGRLLQWREGLASFSEHPLLGVGSNMYRSVNSLGKEAHNSFISILVELGLIGMVLFGIVLLIALIDALALPRWDRAFWLTVLLVWAIGASTLTWEHRKTTWVFLTLLVASAALVTRRDRSSEALALRGTSWVELKAPVSPIDRPQVGGSA
jgi:O-antigen ligase